MRTEGEIRAGGESDGAMVAPNARNRPRRQPWQGRGLQRNNVDSTTSQAARPSFSRQVQGLGLW